jgi:hypothetical protein
MGWKLSVAYCIAPILSYLPYIGTSNHCSEHNGYSSFGSIISLYTLVVPHFVQLANFMSRIIATSVPTGRFGRGHGEGIIMAVCEEFIFSMSLDIVTEWCG